MNKFFYCAAASALLLSAASCSNEEVVNPAQGDPNVMLTVELPGPLDTRSFSDGSSATQLTYQIYQIESDNSLTAVGTPDSSVTFNNRKATVSLKLVNNCSYKILFWAQDSGCKAYTIDWDKRSMSVDYAKLTSNAETSDAFYTLFDTGVVNGPVNKTITLTRPLAQLNWGTNDATEPTVTAAFGANLANARTTLVVNDVYSAFDFNTGDVTGDAASVTFENRTVPTGETFPVETYEYLSMNYLLVPKTKDVADLTLTVTKDGKTFNTINVPSAPLQLNYRTNIYGQLLTSTNNYNVVIDPAFNTPDYKSEIEAKTAEDFMAALKNPGVSEISVPEGSEFDLSNASTEDLSFFSPKTINLPANSTIKLGAANYLTANNGLTIKGGGTITNAGTQALEAGNHKSLIHIQGGDLVMENSTLINDPEHHYHGAADGSGLYNSSAISYWNDANVTLTNVNIKSGEFTICGMRQATGTVELDKCVLESTSSSANNGKNWAYATRLTGSKSVLNNCTVTGIQGGVSVECKEAIINGGNYSTHNSEGHTDAFYAVYVTDGCRLIINDGEFSAPNKRTGLDIGGTSCVVSGDNDVNMPTGSIVVNGGKYSGKPYNHTTNSIYNPSDNKPWEALENDTPYLWTVGK